MTNVTPRIEVSAGASHGIPALALSHAENLETGFLRFDGRETDRTFSWKARRMRHT